MSRIPIWIKEQRRDVNKAARSFLENGNREWFRPYVKNTLHLFEAIELMWEMGERCKVIADISLIPDLRDAIESLQKRIEELGEK